MTESITISKIWLKKLYELIQELDDVSDGKISTDIRERIVYLSGFVSTINDDE